MQCKNKVFETKGLLFSPSRNTIEPAILTVMVTNDNKGKTISVNNGDVQFIFPADEISKYLT